MEDVYFHEQKDVFVLNAIGEILLSKDDIIDIFREVKKFLKTIIPCDFITVLFNNEKSRYFYIVPALNIPQKSEIIIPYNETSVTDILRVKSSINRADLTERGSLTLGDLKFLLQGIASDLSVPIIYRNSVRAILNLSSFKSFAFNEHHQAIVKEVALFLALALERIDFIGEIRNLKLDISQWKNKYTKLLTNLPNPVAVISSDFDFIHEVNTSFEDLTGYNSQQLQGMRFTRLHPQIQSHLIYQSTRDANNGKIAEFEELALVRGDGRQIAVKLRLVAAESKSILFAIYQDLSPQKQAQQADYQRFSQFTSVLRVGEEVLPTHNFELIITSILDELGKERLAKYMVLHLLDENSPELSLFCARKIPPGNNAAIVQPWLLGLAEGPYQDVVATKEIIKFTDVMADPAFFKWTPIAQRLDYRSLISLPLIAFEKVFGVLSLFFEQERTFIKEDLLYLRGMAHYLALFIHDYHLNGKLDDVQNQISVLCQTASSINHHLVIEEIIGTAASETQKIIDFDYFQVTLFDNSTDNYRVILIASEMMKKLIKPKRWSALGNSNLGLLEVSEIDRKGKSSANDIDSKLNSKINALLLSRNKYLGTITLASIEPQKYSWQTQGFLERIANQLAIAIENASLSQAIQKRSNDFSIMLKLSQAFNASLDLNQLLKELIDAVSEITLASLCNIRLVEAGEALPNATSTILDYEQKDLFITEMKEFIPEIVKKLSPLYIEDFKSTMRQLDFHSAQLEFPKNYHTYLGVPLIVNEKVIAVISIYWTKIRQIDEHEINLISIIANQAASVIEKIRSYNETFKYSSDLKSSNQELENFVYTVSHELKSPLVSIKGFSSILLNEFQAVFNEESYRYLKRIQSNANQMEALINDLLELSRIGRVVSEFEDVRVEEIISQVMNELIYQIESRTINIITDKNLPVIRCDKKRISQVFSNLIENAINFMGRYNSDPKIEIGYKDEIDNFLFYVKDNGLGIEKKYHQQIFGLFRRGEPVESESTGTGLGLAIVKRIVENHSGKIWLDSEPGKGSTFFFTIPKKI